MKLTKLAAALAAAMAMGMGSAQAAISTDIVMIVDESGSMGTVQANLRTNIGLFASILAAGGVDARFALVGYGNSSVVPRLITDFTTATNFATAALGLQISGGTEPGYTASAFALNAIPSQAATLSYRTNAVENLIIYTDEPLNGDTSTRGGGIAWTQALVDQALTNNNALYNAVLSGSSTINSYSALATNHNGAVFNLSLMNTTNQSVVQQFMQDFAAAKLQETLTFCQLNPTAPECQGSTVPEPGSMALLGLGLFGLFGLRRYLGNSCKNMAVA